MATHSLQSKVIENLDSVVAKMFQLTIFWSLGGATTTKIAKIGCGM